MYLCLSKKIKNMSNTHFKNREDAERHAKNYGGKVMDNRNSCHEWKNNDFTVAGDRLSDVSKESKIEDFENQNLYGYVKMSRDQHERWMNSKGWSDSIKNHHRKEFTGAMEFDGEGSFEYVNP